MFKVVLAAALVTLAVATDFCRDGNGDSLLDGFYRLGDSCRHFVQCKDGENALPNDAFMSCEHGLQFVSGAIAANEDGERTQQGACMNGGDALDCDEEEIRQKRETLEEPTNGTLAVNNVDMTVFNVERPKRQTEEIIFEEAEALLEEEKKHQNATLTVNNKDISVININKRVRRQAVESPSEGAAKNGTLAVNNVDMTVFNVERPKRQAEESLPANATIVELGREKRQAAEIVEQEAKALLEEEKRDQNATLTINNEDVTVFNVERPKRQAESIVEQEAKAILEEEKNDQNATLTINNEDVTVFNIERPKRQAAAIVEQEAKAILEEEKNDQNATLTINNEDVTVFNVKRDRRQAAASSSDEAKNATLAVNNADVTVFNIAGRARRQAAAEEKIIDGETVVIPAGAEIEEPIVVEVVAPSEEKIASTRATRQARKDGDACNDVKFNGLYMIRSAFCDAFIECKGNENVLANGDVMQCDEGLMFARGSQITKDGAQYNSGECVEFDTETCETLQQTL